MLQACTRCAQRAGGADNDNFCPACGRALTDSAASRALIPTEVRSGAERMALLPAVRADLAPFAPALRSAAAVIAAAALTDWTMRCAAPALARQARGLVQGRRQPRPQVTRTTMIEQQITVRQWISVRS